ncbi:hypothetical protein E1B28_013866 [Marasmius oreades]|uniref:SAC3/GANP/THP3 conserved domain-containing protein n=1 Tax=Marasmius oreades TaxID=181124 RepID=A0A9P7UIN2_9AGAR|nr:uncharacterized protein E1B28_013866 [Marasmius oreades]KAG7085262.1 hypothetical protein E1B28_013866 [Marasmius oreades]
MHTHCGRRIGMAFSYKGSLSLLFLSFLVDISALISLLTKLPSVNLKRKLHDSPQSNKKAKKSTVKQVTSGTAALDLNDQVALNRRAERFQREHEIERQRNVRTNGHYQSSLKVNHHHAHLLNSSRSSSPFGGLDEPEADPVRSLCYAIFCISQSLAECHRLGSVYHSGTSKEIFKDYLRITTEPKPEQIRPYLVLQETLIQLKKRWREKCSYSWICNQLKSLRQDLTVQRIKNEFTVQVYEIHARMALESNDMVEYNQCQATLKTLYELGIPGKVEEFTAYRILMLLHGRNRSELNLYVGQLTPKQKTDTAVKHALSVQRSLSMGNYHSLFMLYMTAPNMGAYIMDHFIDRERTKALMVIVKAYRTIGLTFIQNELAFDDLDATRKFLEEHKAPFYTNPTARDSEKVFDCKPAMTALAQVYEEKYRRIGIKGAI